MNTKETLNKVRTLLGIQVKFEQQKLDGGAILEAESFEIGAEIFVVSDDERVAVPIGEYKTEEGKIIVVAEEGIIAEIKEPENEEVAEVEEEELAKEEVAPKKVVESVSKETFFAEIEKLRNEIKELKLSKVEEVELKAESIVHTPENKEVKELNLYSQKGKNNVLNNIFNKINK